MANLQLLLLLLLPTLTPALDNGLALTPPVRSQPVPPARLLTADELLPSCNDTMLWLRRV
jgi:hypothetical protein